MSLFRPADVGDDANHGETGGTGLLGGLKDALGLGGRNEERSEGHSYEECTEVRTRTQTSSSQGAKTQTDRWDKAEAETEAAKQAAKRADKLSGEACETAKVAVSSKKEADLATTQYEEARRHAAEHAALARAKGLEAAEYQDKLQKAQKVLHDKLQKADLTKKERDEAQAEYDRLVKEAREFEQTTKAKQAEAAELQRKLDALVAEKERLANEASRVREHVETVQTTLQEKKELADHLEGELRDARALVEQAEQRLNEVRATADNKAREFARARKAYEEAAQQVPAHSDKADRLAGQAEAKAGDIDELKNQVERAKREAADAETRAGYAADSAKASHGAAIAAGHAHDENAHIAANIQEDMRKKEAEAAKLREQADAQGGKAKQLTDTAAEKSRTAERKMEQATAVAQEYTTVKGRVDNARAEEQEHWERAKRQGNAAQVGEQQGGACKTNQDIVEKEILKTTRVEGSTTTAQATTANAVVRKEE